MSAILYQGKSKTIYEGPDSKSVVMHFRNSTTAFDGKKKEELNGKGVLNVAISNLLYDYLSKNGVETHLIKVIDDTSILVKKVEIIAVEIIVRNIAAGSLSSKYGIAEGSKLKNTTLEFSLKSDALGDPMINMTQITALGIATRKELEGIIAQTQKINKLLKPFFEKAGICLVDFKLEFGRYEGRIILADEISPDSCRLWDIKTNAKMDKDRFRRDLGNVLDSYGEVLRRLKNV